MAMGTRGLLDAGAVHVVLLVEGSLLRAAVLCAVVEGVAAGLPYKRWRCLSSSPLKDCNMRSPAGIPDIPGIPLRTAGHFFLPPSATQRRVGRANGTCSALVGH